MSPSAHLRAYLSRRHAPTLMHAGRKQPTIRARDALADGASMLEARDEIRVPIDSSSDRLYRILRTRCIIVTGFVRIFIRSTSAYLDRMRVGTYARAGPQSDGLPPKWAAVPHFSAQTNSIQPI